MSKEVKIGILALVAIIGSVWGYAFLKGKNLLTNSSSYYAKFENIEQLPISAPVLISGVQVGTVSSKSLDADDMKTVTVELDIENKYSIPVNTVATLVSMGLMGQKGIELKMSGPCSGANCAQSGDFLQAKVQGMMEGMLGEDTLGDAFKGLGDGIGTAFDTINQRLSDPANDGRISKILKNIDELSASLTKTSSNLNRLIYSTDKNLSSLATNMNSVVGNLKKNNVAIEDILKNAAGFTEQLNNSDLEGAVNNVSKTMNSADAAMASLDGTIKELDATISNFKSIASDINSGQGTMGKLVKDEELYNNLNRTLFDLDKLLQDFRLNPKRYVNVSVFGKKQKEYELPEDDPAREEMKSEDDE